MADGDIGVNLVVAISDMIFETKIRTTADRLGVRMATTRDADHVVALLEKHQPALLLVDLNTVAPGAIDVVRAGCTHACSPAVIAFVSHVDARLAKEAADAGAHQVLPRSKFSADLPLLISEHCSETD